MGPRHHLSFCARNTAWLAPELLVSMGPNPYLWFLHSKQRPLDSNNKSLRVPDITCRFVHAIQRYQHRNYLSLWVPTLICGYWMPNSEFWPRISSLYGIQSSSAVFACQTTSFGPELQVSMCPSPFLWFLHAKQRLLELNYNSVWDPDLTCRFVRANQRD